MLNRQIIDNINVSDFTKQYEKVISVLSYIHALEDAICKNGRFATEYFNNSEILKTPIDNDYLLTELEADLMSSLMDFNSIMIELEKG